MGWDGARAGDGVVGGWEQLL